MNQEDFNELIVEARAGGQLIAYMMVAISGGIVGFALCYAASVLL